MQVTDSTSASQGFSLAQSLGASGASREEFLHLLVTQLKNQDPFDPIKNEDFLTQLATFSQLEEQQKTSSSIQSLIDLQSASLALGGLSQGASLLGREVTWVGDDGLQTFTGTVDAVSFTPSGIQLSVGDATVPLGNVIGLGAAAGQGGDPTAPPDGSGGGTPPASTPSPSLSGNTETPPTDVEP